MPTPQSDPAPNDNFRYDVFISYSHLDREWVRRELLPQLKARGLLCIEYHDFEPGAPSVKEMERAIVTSRKSLLILTLAYIESAWTEFEALMLQVLDPANRERRLIPLLKEKCDLPLRLRYLTYVNFADPEEPEFAWRQLLTALGAPPELPTPPPHPAEIKHDQRIDGILRQLDKLNGLDEIRSEISRLSNLVDKLVARSPTGAVAARPSPQEVLAIAVWLNRIQSSMAIIKKGIHRFSEGGSISNSEIWQFYSDAKSAEELLDSARVPDLAKEAHSALRDSARFYRQAVGKLYSHDQGAFGSRLDEAKSKSVEATKLIEELSIDWK